MNGVIPDLLRWLRGLAGRPARASDPPAVADDPRRAAVVLRACACVRVGDCDQAEDLLESGLLAESDPARLNLLGAVCEKRGRWAEARRLYGRAIRADRTFAPPRQNIRRWFEMDTFGRTTLPLLLGDEEPRLWWMRRRAVEGDGAGRDRSADSPRVIGVSYHDN